MPRGAAASNPDFGAASLHFHFYDTEWHEIKILNMTDNILGRYCT